MSYDTDRYFFDRASNAALFLTECGIQICHVGHAAPPLKYADFSMHFVLEGKGFYEIGGTHYPLSAGEGFLIKPEDICTYTADEKEPWKYIYISFRGTLAKDLVQRVGLSEKCTFSFENSALMRETLYKMHAVGKENAHGGMDALGLFLFAMGQLIPKTQSGKEGHADARHLRRAKRYIEDNYAFGIRIEDVALHACIERSYLYRLFMRHEGCSPLAYLNEVRLSHATALLKESTLSLSEIGAAVGFFDSSHFSKAFIKKYGCTPGVFRKNQKA